MATLLKWMWKEAGKEQHKGDMGLLRQQGGGSCPHNGKVRMEGRGQEGVKRESGGS